MGMEQEQGHPRPRGRPGPDPGAVARARELRVAGLSDRAIGTELGVSHKSVARWLAGEEPGHGPDGKFKARDDVDPGAVARLRDEPVTQARTRSWREIGAALGISHETTRRRYASKEAAVNDLERRAPEDDLDGELTE